MVSRRPGRYLKTFLEPVASFSLSMSPWRAMGTPFVPKIKDNLLKIDVLALGMLTAIQKCLDLVSAYSNEPLTIQKIPAEDPRVYDMMCKADTVGVFQIESRAQMSMLPRLRPRSYYDLVIQIAIVRPGPIQGDMVHPYLNRRSGKELVTYPSDAVKATLERTLGVPIFQEQVMQLAMLAAGRLQTADPD